MQVVILAGGLGSRLYPLTQAIPKPMVLINDKPFLEYLIFMLKRNSFKKILLCVGYLGDKIENYFGDGRDWGVQIEYSYEKELLGTGGALKLASNLIEEEFLLLYGDSYMEIDFNEFMAFFKKHNTIGSVVVYDNAMGDTEVKNNIALDGNIITAYIKNKDDMSLKYVEAGVSMYKKKIFDLIDEKKIVSLENEIFPILISNRELTGYKSSKRFFDIGTFDRLNLFQGLQI